MLRVTVLAVVCAAAFAAPPATSGNMNGLYKVASGGNQGVPFNSDYASKGYEYFDVWAPEIATHYGEVFWTDQGNNPIPQAIIDRFKGKTMAIMGYEQDQVMVSPVGQPGVNPSQDVSVPINWAYNHHYMAWMTGAHSELVRVEVDPNDVTAHGSPTKLIAVDKPSAAFRKDTSTPTSQMFSEGNGGESRKSFHGYPKGFAQLIDSPETWHITPMQIDTRERDCGVTPESVKNCTRFTPGPEPKQARYGRGTPAGTNYSGILECPCNTRYGGDPVIYGDSVETKEVEHLYSAIASGTCSAGEGMSSPATCFSAVASLGFNATKFVQQNVSDPKFPEGCTVTPQADGSAIVAFNTAPSTVPCAASNRRLGQTTSQVGTTLALNLDAANVTFERSPKGEYCADNHQGIIAAFNAAGTTPAEELAALEQCEAACKQNDGCWGCSVDMYNAAKKLVRWVAIPSCGTVMHWSGSIAGDISQKVATGNATITISGPADAWFGVGFNAVEMSDSPYTLIVNSTGVIEQKIGTCGSEAEHCPGTQLSSTVHVVSAAVENGVRTVVMTRPLVGATKDHYTFSLQTASIPFISAVGSSQVFAYHKAHTSAEISLTAPTGPTCVCDLGANGKLCETDGTGCNSFVKDCVAAPAGSLLAQRNPTCNSRQYAGGLRCCGHKRILLDADQEIRPELLRYHMKFRFWFQEYVPATATSNASHANLDRIYYQTEAHAGEYDVPPAFAKPGEKIVGYPDWPVGEPTPGTTCTGTCPDGPDCECEHIIKFHWNLSNVRLIYAGGHCHAPSCISMELYRNDTGTPQLLCRQVPVIGQGNVDHDKYDESGYIALPPCLWGDDEGLEASQLLPENTPMFSLKRNRNTRMGHFGEMASWQMRGVNF